MRDAGVAVAAHRRFGVADELLEKALKSHSAGSRQSEMIADLEALKIWTLRPIPALTRRDFTEELLCSREMLTLHSKPKSAQLREEIFSAQLRYASALLRQAGHPTRAESAPPTLINTLRKVLALRDPRLQPFTEIAANEAISSGKYQVAVTGQHIHQRPRSATLGKSPLAPTPFGYGVTGMGRFAKQRGGDDAERAEELVDVAVGEDIPLSK